MNRNVFRIATLCVALVVGAIALAATTRDASADRPTSSAPARSGARALTRPSTTASTTASTTSTSTSTTSSTTTTSTTTTTARPPPFRPGPMAAPRPAAPVVLTGATPVLDRVPTTDKVIFLGIDDGLVRDRALLTLMLQERIPLTLFLVRQPAQDGVDFFHALQELGATVQVHTRNHPHLRTLGWSDQQREICDEIPELTSWYGGRPELFRPPYGEWDATTRAVAATCGLKAIVLWRGTTNDGRLDVVGGKFSPGDIILMHFRTDLVENLRLVIDRARAEGFRIGRLEDYLGTGPPHPMFDR
jgi:peptidoglycan/xylan/chitin deacetylase (PgdA/CDA1 family)